MEPPKKKHTLMWIATVFMGLSAIVFFPSICSIIALIFAVIAAPIGPMQKFFSEHGLRGFAKGAVLCAAFVGTMITAPTNSTPTADNTTRGTLPSMAVTQETARPTKSPKPTETPEPTSTPMPESTPTPTPEPTPTPAPTPEPTPTPAPAPATTPAPAQNAQSQGGNSGGGNGNGSNFNTWDNPSQQQTSNWVLNTSTMKVHYPSCSSVSRIAPRNYATSNASLSDLLNRGYSRCGRCF